MEGQIWIEPGSTAALRARSYETGCVIMESEYDAISRIYRS